MRRVASIIIGLFLATNIWSQTQTYTEVDTTSYNMYMREDWKQLVSFAKEAEKEGYDYFYLHMRIAYACYMQKDYRQAAKYFEMALRHNKADEAALSYAYHSYLYSGNSADALRIRKYFDNELNEKLGIKDSLKIISFGIDYTYSSSNASGSIDQIIDELASNEDGIQKATYDFRIPGIHFSHRFNHQISLRHSLSYMQKNEFSNTVVNATSYISPQQTVKQFEYNVNAQVAPARGWLIQAGYHYLYTSIPVYSSIDYGRDVSPNRNIKEFLSIKTNIYHLGVSKSFSRLKLGASYVFHNMNEQNNHQTGMHLSYYPFGNLNVYGIWDGYIQAKELKNGSFDQIHKLSLGLKIHNNLWIEAMATFPENFAFYDQSANIAYNAMEKNHYKSGINFILPLYKMKSTILLSYKYAGTNSYFFPNDPTLELTNQHQYQNHSITGGITWKL